jgi:cobalt-zinc-cadmium efflux system membrane fusion protein
MLMRFSPSSSRSFRCALAATLLTCLGCGGATAAQSDDEGAPSDAVTAVSPGVVQLSEAAQAFVQVAPVVIGRDVSVLRVPARVAYRDGSVAQVGSPVAGRVTELRVHVGDHVEVGAPLVVLSSPDAAATRAQLSAASAQLEAGLAEARRTADMLESGVGTERERREADLHVSEIEIDLARLRAQVAIVGRGARGQVTLRAPIAGTVLSRRAAIGMTVEPSAEDALIEIGDPSALGVTADVFDRDASEVRVGASCEVSFPSVDHPLAGHVAYVAPLVSSGMRTVPVRIELDALPPDARPGLFGRASISLVDSGIVIPAAAVLVRDGNQTVVYREQAPGRYEQHAVQVGPSVDGQVHVTGGLAEGDRVITRGALLIDGASDMLL